MLLFLGVRVCMGLQQACSLVFKFFFWISPCLWLSQRMAMRTKLCAIFLDGFESHLIMGLEKYGDCETDSFILADWLRSIECRKFRRTWICQKDILT